MAGKHSLFGPVDPAADAGYDEDHPARMGFFTDTTVCIGCKACEVACKEWNDVPADHFEMLGSSYDNSCSLNANQWRHVAFIEQPQAAGRAGVGAAPPGGRGGRRPGDAVDGAPRTSEPTRPGPAAPRRCCPSPARTTPWTGPTSAG